MAASIETESLAVVMGPPLLPGVINQTSLSVVMRPENPGIISMLSLFVVMEPIQYTASPQPCFLSFGG